MRTVLMVLCLVVPVAAGADDVRVEPLNVSSVRAFENLVLDRPIVVTHAGDDSGRIFVAEQKGIIRVFPNDEAVEEADVFLDIDDRCVYRDNQNEEGMLGFAFHPKFRTNGYFYLYYTTASAEHTSVISRFSVSKTDPGRADPDSEYEIMRIPQPFWNHNGGTIVFGPDGYFYVGLGDGGSANDPDGNGQNLTTFLGSILRIDVDREEGGRHYAIPKDNPFVGKMLPARGSRREVPAAGEIYAYGLRNVWRMAFDRETGLLWVGDVGQNLWEEINIVTKGGNYGWNIREARHWFRPDGNDAPREDLIDPIWEYHHDIGKSITGGSVYRGTKVPELVGKYVYADYVSGLIWALEYDHKAQKVIANQPISADKLQVMSFGEDQSGELYYTTVFGTLHRFQSGGAGSTPGN